jgi:hypothetical protein
MAVALLSLLVPVRLINWVKGVGVGEDVVRCLAIGMLIGVAKARHSERCTVGKRSSEVEGAAPARIAVIVPSTEKCSALRSPFTSARPCRAGRDSRRPRARRLPASCP